MTKTNQRCPRCAGPLATGGLPEVYYGAVSLTDQQTTVCARCGLIEEMERREGVLTPQAEWLVEYPVSVRVFNATGFSKDFVAYGPRDLAMKLPLQESVLPLRVLLSEGVQMPADTKHLPTFGPFNTDVELFLATVKCIESVHLNRLVDEANTSTDPQRLTVLARSRHLPVRAVTAANPHLPSAILDAMADDESSILRQLVALIGATTQPPSAAESA